MEKVTYGLGRCGWCKRPLFLTPDTVRVDLYPDSPEAIIMGTDRVPTCAACAIALEAELIANGCDYYDLRR